MEAQTLTCMDCDVTFEWTAGEQAFYAAKQLSSPRRCQPCRRARRERQGEESVGAFDGWRPRR